MAQAASSAWPDMSFENADDVWEVFVVSPNGFSWPGLAIAARWKRLCLGISFSTLTAVFALLSWAIEPLGGRGVALPSIQSLT